MAKNSSSRNTPPEAVISIIGVGMTIEGDSETDGSLRIEGTIRGNVRAGKSVVVGRDGLVDGSIYTQDAVISGRVLGGIHAVSRLELLATSEVLGEIEAPRMQVEEGAKVQGQVTVGEATVDGGSGVAKAGTLGGGGRAGRKPEAQPEVLEEEEPETFEEEEPEALGDEEPEAGTEKQETVRQEHSRERDGTVQPGYLSTDVENRLNP
jgi:cytoskeletal protein CcmA (bactofilin family)